MEKWQIDKKNVLVLFFQIQTSFSFSYYFPNGDIESNQKIKRKKANKNAIIDLKYFD